MNRRFMQACSCAFIVWAWLSTSDTAMAGVRVAFLHIAELNCAFCGYPLEDRLKRAEGVLGVSLDLRREGILVSFGEDEFPGVERLAEIVDNAGYEVTRIELELSADIRTRDGKKAIEIPEFKRIEYDPQIRQAIQLLEGRVILIGRLKILVGETTTLRICRLLQEPNVSSFPSCEEQHDNE